MLRGQTLFPCSNHCILCSRLWEEVFSLEARALFTYVPVAPKKKKKTRDSIGFIILLEGNDGSLLYNKERLKSGTVCFSVSVIISK